MSYEIKIIGVDKENIKMSPNKKDFWVVPFKLSEKPDESWDKKFYDVQQKDTNFLKRKAHLSEDFIAVEVGSADDLKKILDVMKAEVTETNVLCEEDYQRKLKIREELESLQQRQRDTTKKLQDDSDKLVF